MNICIVCNLENNSQSVEHIVSEGFGNKKYTLEKGELCDNCNNRFSKFEGKALSNSIFVMERARLGVPTKKNKNVKGQVKELKIAGAKDYTKDLVSIDGLSTSNFKLDPGSKTTGKLRIEAFDKSEAATSKLLLKIAIESIYKSRRQVYKKYDFQELKDYLLGKSNNDWGFITARKKHGSFFSIPRFNDKFHLKRLDCHLELQELSNNEVIFRFDYRGITMLINLLNRSVDWVQPYKENEKFANLYPAHVERTYNKKLK